MWAIWITLVPSLTLALLVVVGALSGSVLVLAREVRRNREHVCHLSQRIAFLENLQYRLEPPKLAPGGLARG